jgi:hypothetical protein
MHSYHRRLGNLSLVFVTLHFICAAVNVEEFLEDGGMHGLVSWIFLVLVFVFSFWFIRRNIWELFYYSHHALVVCVFVFAQLHTAEIERQRGNLSVFLWWVLPGLVLFSFDRIGRLVCSPRDDSSNW